MYYKITSLYSEFCCFLKYISSAWESFLYIFSSFLLGKLVDFLPFSVQIYPRLVSILDMNSTSFTCVNNSKICDLYGSPEPRKHV